MFIQCRTGFTAVLVSAKQQHCTHQSGCLCAWHIGMETRNQSCLQIVQSIGMPCLWAFRLLSSILACLSGEWHVAQWWHQTQASMLLVTWNKRVERKKLKIRATHKAFFFFQVKWQPNNKVVTYKPVFYPASVQWSDLGTIRQLHRRRKSLQLLSRQKLIRNHYSHWSRMASSSVNGIGLSNILTIPSLQYSLWNRCTVCFPMRFDSWVRVWDYTCPCWPIKFRPMVNIVFFVCLFVCDVSSGTIFAFC